MKTPDLFGFGQTTKKSVDEHTPLAERVRPQRLEEFVGHEEILAPGTILFEEIKRGHPKSMIFWGPPGVGKTTLARIIAREVNADFVAISAVSTGVSEVRKIIERAAKARRYQNRLTILFIDEIHRFNKAQQDALLHAVEDGTIVLIGATTENPSFEVISPLLSRCQIYQMKPLSDEDIRKILQAAIQKDPLLQKMQVKLQDEEALIRLAGGDARRALNILEKALELKSHRNPPIVLKKEDYEKAALQKVLYYDKTGEYHYDLISAFIKSLRGSDPDAAIYWMARMLEAGEDPKFIARRMIILAAEDIGNADPYALTLATSCFTAVTYVGMPESKIILSQVAAYLAAAPKSNSAVVAINEAIEDVRKKPDIPVPLHLRNAPTSLLADLGYGKDYKYVHDYPDHFVPEVYLPEPFGKRIYYVPSDQGEEKKLRERLVRLWKNQKGYPFQSDDKQGKKP